MTLSIKKISLVSTISTLLFLLPSCGSKSKNASPGPSEVASLNSYSVGSVTAPTPISNSITIKVPADVVLTNLTDAFSVSAGSSVTLTNFNGIKTTCSTTTCSPYKDFSHPVTYTITSKDSTVNSNYSVTVQNESTPPASKSLCNAVSCSQSKDALTKVLNSGILTDGFTPVNMDCTIPNLNFEDEQYQTDMISIKKDRLTINVKKTETKFRFCNNLNSSFVSGRIDTSNKFNFTKDEQGHTILNGAVEVTAAVPYGKGLWPAIWMLPLNSNWPTGMELDFAEFQSYSSGGAPLGTHVHYGNGDQTPIVWNYDGNGADNLFMPNVSDASPLTPQVAHNYGFTWNCTAYKSACNLSWYFDGSKYLTMHLDPVSTKSYLLDSNGKKPFVNRPNPPTWAERPSDPAAAAFTSWWYGLDKGYYLILNVAVGGKGLASDNQPDWDSFPDATSMDILGIKSYLLN